MPKKASIPYIQFATEQVPLLKKDPQYLGAGPKWGFRMVNGEEMKHTDFMKIAGENWGKITDKDKKKYDALAAKD